MPLTTDPDAIRGLLDRDPAWSLYALGDQAPGYQEHAEWHLAENGQAIALVYRLPGTTPVLFTGGAIEALPAVLDELQAEPELYLSVLPEVIPLIAARWSLRDLTPMRRMIVTTDTFQPARTTARRLSPHDLAALEALFADGLATQEAPDFFFPHMLADGFFCGVEEHGELAAAAGTHLVASTLHLAAIGNVYTRRAARGRGLARQATSAVTVALMQAGFVHIGLNVKQSNMTAQRVYTSLGFTVTHEFREGLAVRGKPRTGEENKA